LAFAVGNFFSSEDNYDEYDDYGAINMYYEYWDSETDILSLVPTRPCSKDDFQNSGNKTDVKFFKADETKKNEFQRKMNILKCTEQPLNMIGNWNTGRA